MSPNWSNRKYKIYLKSTTKLNIFPFGSNAFSFYCYLLVTLKQTIQIFCVTFLLFAFYPQFKYVNRLWIDCICSCLFTCLKRNHRFDCHINPKLNFGNKNLKNRRFQPLLESAILHCKCRMLLNWRILKYEVRTLVFWVH